MALNSSTSSTGAPLGLSDPIDWSHTLSHVADAIALFDGQLRCRFMNPTLAQWFRVPATALLHQSCTDWLATAQIPAAGQSLARSLQAALQRCFDHAPNTFPTTITTAFTDPVTAEMCELRLTPVPTETGAIAEVLVLGQRRPPVEPTLSQPLIGAEMPGLAEQTDPLIANLFTPRRLDATAAAPAVGTVQATGDALDALAVPFVRPETPDLVIPHAAQQPLPEDAMLSKSKEVLRLVLNNIPQYIFWKDREFRYLGCNQRWAEMAGLSHPKAVIGLTDADLPWTEEQRDWYLQCDRQVMETNTPMLKIRQSQRQADGQITWREVNKLPLHDENGHVIGLLGTIEDVTERKRTEDLLRASETRYRRLANQERIINQVANQMRRSLNLQKILQTVVEEVRQILDTDRVVVYQFNPDWRGTVVTEDVRDPWVSVLGDMGADDCFPAKFAGLYGEGRVRVIDDLDDPALDQCHVEFLRSIQVQSNLIVPILSRSRLWGLLIAHACDAPRQWQAEEIELLRYLAEQLGIAIRQAELYQAAQDSAKTAAAQAAKLEAAMHKLQQTQAQLVQTEKMSSLGQLVAGIAHEINNPVNFIFGNVAHIQGYISDLTGLIDLYQSHYPNPATEIIEEVEAIDLDFIITDLNKVLKSVRIGSERIREIVLSLRTFSRLDEAEVKAVNLHEGIDSTLLILQHRLKAQGERPEIDITKDYGDLPKIRCHPSQLNQVFMNILSNAIDALEEAWDKGQESERRSPTIQISTSCQPDQEAVQVLIKDNGVGMPESVRQHLFDPFFTTKSVGKGTGLGLSISYQIIVEKHNGTIICQSEPGQGTEFLITIPQN